MLGQELREHKQYYERSELYPFVSLASAQAVATGMRGLESWRRASLRKRPETIYDINGRPLFLDYRLVGREGDVGYVRAAASKVLGTPIVAHLVGARHWDYPGAVKKLTPTVVKSHPGWRIRTTKLVCYSYPKMGVMFTLSDERGKTHRLIYDVASHSRIPEAKPGQEGEGAVAWSFYDSLTEGQRSARLERLDGITASAQEMPSSVMDVLRDDVRVSHFVDAAADLFVTHETRLLEFCAHYRYDEERSHHCFTLHGQETAEYCAPATCQMILCYYRYYFSQDQIAPALGYTPGWGCDPDHSAGFESLTNHQLKATYDDQPTWEKARDQIRGLRPLKSGVRWHTRACAGYAWSLHRPGGGRCLYIYDPWPNHPDYKTAGEIYWEDWDAVHHTNYIYVGRKV